MGRLERIRKIRRLEARTEGVAASVAQLEEALFERAIQDAVRLLSTEDLVVLDGVIELALATAINEEKGGDDTPGSLDLYLYAGDARGREALVALDRALEHALRAVEMEGEL